MKTLLECLVFIVIALFPVAAFAQDRGSLALGYGFAVLSEPGTIGRVEEGHYDFVQFSCLFERPLTEKLGFLIEPFAAYVNRPSTGVDAGILLSARYHLRGRHRNGLFLTLGGGSAYTTVGFKEQGTHWVLILQAGIGFKWEEFFIENRLRHYSNGGYRSTEQIHKLHYYRGRHGFLAVEWKSPLHRLCNPSTSLQARRQKTPSQP